MKPQSLPLVFVALAGFTVPTIAKLTAHEWGTFTVLQGPDGNTLTWYQSAKDVTPLPKFVTEKAGELRGFRPKASHNPDTRYSIRMETPVLYFYPDAPMEVKVWVDFPGGVLTETYPHASAAVDPSRMLLLNTLRELSERQQKEGGSAGTTTDPAKVAAAEERFRRLTVTAEAQIGQQAVEAGWKPEELKTTGIGWKGSLVTPTLDNLMDVPGADGPFGRHYAAARAVPDAWLFKKPGVGGKTEVDHFIFYRGAGNDVSRTIRVTTSDDRSFTLKNTTPDAVPVLFLLNVADGKSAWKRVENLLPYKFTTEFKPQVTFKEEGLQTVTLPELSGPLAQSTAGLKAEMLATLEKEGLTKAEAAAMVATWDDLWFEEPGTRVLAVLPQPWVDAVLPLEITPKPEVIERVFVARVEVISNARQNALVELLNKSGNDPAAAREDLQRLELGRFAAGALDRAVTVKTREVDSQMRSKFAELSKPAPPAEKAPSPVVGKAP